MIGSDTRDLPLIDCRPASKRHVPTQPARRHPRSCGLMQLSRSCGPIPLDRPAGHQRRGPPRRSSAVRCSSGRLGARGWCGPRRSGRGGFAVGKPGSHGLRRRVDLSGRLDIQRDFVGAEPSPHRRLVRSGHPFQNPDRQWKPYRRAPHRVLPQLLALVDGDNVSGQGKVLSDEGPGICERFGDDYSQVFHREPWQWPRGAHELRHHVPDGGRWEELAFGHQTP